MGKTYAFSDLHGQYGLWEQIRNFLQPDDKVYCLGDCIDRGPAGYAILKEVLADKRITLLKGNHEQFMEICVGDYLQGRNSSTMYLWCSMNNGGSDTWKDIEKLSEREMEDLIYNIGILPERVDIVNAKG